jgi:hypothetical protein
LLWGKGDWFRCFRLTWGNRRTKFKATEEGEYYAARDQETVSAKLAKGNEMRELCEARWAKREGWRLELWAQAKLEIDWWWAAKRETGIKEIEFHKERDIEGRNQETEWCILTKPNTDH